MMLADLRSELERNNHLRPGLTWRRLEGGRTNRLWQIGDGAEALVCKLYSPDDGNPMFPNLARDEYAILTGLAGMGLAPDPVAHLALSGVEIVLYRHVRAVARNQAAGGFTGSALWFGCVDGPDPGNTWRLP
jgi:hypothetical protein